MRYYEIDSIHLNGEILAGEHLSEYCRMQLDTPYLESWKESIFTFLLEWLDEIPFITTWTSGSTGEPKSISIHKQHMVNSALMTGKYLGLEEGDAALLCLPAEYIAGKMMLVRSMVLGLELRITEPKNDPLDETAQNFDFAAMVPLQLHDILQQAQGFEKLKRIRKLIIGGGPVPVPLREKIKQLDNQSYSTYGMTETVSHIAMEKLNGSEADGLYHLLPGIEIETDDQGRLIILAPDLRDESIHTNDLVEILDQNTFRVLGRYDNMIISGGINIIPELLEKKLEPFIRERFIISSVPDEKLGEKVVLVIEGLPQDLKGLDKINKQIASKLGKYEQARDIILVHEFPETANGKIDRRKLQMKIMKNLR